MANLTSEDQIAECQSCEEVICAVTKSQSLLGRRVAKIVAQWGQGKLTEAEVAEEVIIATFQLAQQEV